MGLTHNKVFQLTSLFLVFFAKSHKKTKIKTLFNFNVRGSIMKISITIVAVILIINFSLPLQAEEGDSAVTKYLEKNRPAGFGPANIVARTDGDLTNDGIDDSSSCVFMKWGIRVIEVGFDT